MLGPRARHERQPGNPCAVNGNALGGGSILPTDVAGGLPDFLGRKKAVGKNAERLGKPWGNVTVFQARKITQGL